MSKIDTSKIPGYAEMSTEQKLAALEAYEETSDSDTELEKLRKAVAKANAEAAESKRQLRAKQTDEEAKKAEQESFVKDLQDKYDALLKQSTIRGYADKFRKMGYDDKLAADTAKALVDGNFEKVFENGTAYKAALEQTVRAEVLKSTPKPLSGGQGVSYKTVDEIMNIEDTATRQQAIAENIDLFKQEE